MLKDRTLNKMISINERLIEAAEEYCKKNDLSFSALVRSAITEYLSKRNEETEEDEETSVKSNQS